MKPCLLLLVFSAALAAQTVEGDVVDAVTGAPVEGAYVSTSGSHPLVSRTDAAGHFLLLGAPLGYDLRVARTGYLPGSRTLSSRPDQPGPGIRIVLTPGAVMAGKLEDEDGFPVERANVQALRYQIVNGQRKLQIVALTQSDDLGQYRLTNLRAGRYHVRVTPWDLSTWDRRYVSHFFPGTLQPEDINLVEVEAGQERQVNMRLTKYDGVSVAGILVMPAGAPTAGRMWVFLRQPDLADSYMGALQRDGSFMIRHVPPGSYMLRASSAGDPPKAGDLRAERPLLVGDSDVRDLVLTFHEVQAVDLPGVVVLEGGGSLRPMWIGLRSTAGLTVAARSNDDGSFVLKGLLPGHYNLEVQPDIRVVNSVVDPASAAHTSDLISARLGEREVLPQGFDLDGPPSGPLRITFSSRQIIIGGSLLDAAGRPVAGAVRMLMPGGSACHATAYAKADGSFRATLRVAGEYHIYTVADQSQAISLWDPDYLEAHNSDHPPVRVVEGPNPPITLRLPVK